MLSARGEREAYSPVILMRKTTVYGYGARALAMRHSAGMARAEMGSEACNYSRVLPPASRVTWWTAQPLGKNK